MKYRYKLLELRRMRDNLMRFLEVCDLEPKEAYDNPYNPLRMGQKLALCAELTRLQHRIYRIEAMPHGRIDDDCGDFEIIVPSKMNPPTQKLPHKKKKQAIHSKNAGRKDRTQFG